MASTLNVRCPWCPWYQRHIEFVAAGAGVLAVSHRCENGRCRRWMVALFRVGSSPAGDAWCVTFHGTRPRLGRDAQSFRASLLLFGGELAAAEVEILAASRAMLAPAA